MTDGLRIHRTTAPAAATRAVEVLRERLDDGATPGDIAVLARVSSALLPVQVMLTEAGIGHSAVLDAKVLQRTGVRTALAYLRLGLDPERIRRDDLLQTINRPARKVRSAVEPLLPRGRSLTLDQLANLVRDLDEVHQERFGDYLDDLAGLAAAVSSGADTGGLLRIVRERIGLGAAMDALDSSRTRPEGSSHGDDLDALEQLATLHPDPTSFQAWLASRLEVPADPAGVVLSTIHRVKGMEWDHVVVVAANAGLFPHRLAEDPEEERRVFHVAVTRCRVGVDIIADRARTSPFVAELATGAEHRAPRGDAHPRRGDPGGPRLLAGTEVVATPGLVVELPGGIPGLVEAAGADDVTLTLPPHDPHDPHGASPLTVRVPHGTPVRLPQLPADGGSAGRYRLVAGGSRGPGTPDLAAPAGAGATGSAGPRGGGAGQGRLLDTDGQEADPALFEALRSWRARTANASNLPAFVILHDRTLTAIAARRPRTPAQLATIPGIGPAKLDRFGDDLLDVVADHG